MKESELIRKLNNLSAARARVARANERLEALARQTEEGKRILTQRAKDETLTARLEKEIKPQVLELAHTVKGQDLNAVFYRESYSYDKKALDVLAYPEVILARRPKNAYVVIK